MVNKGITVFKKCHQLRGLYIIQSEIERASIEKKQYLDKIFEIYEPLQDLPLIPQSQQKLSGFIVC